MTISTHDIVQEGAYLLLADGTRMPVVDGHLRITVEVEYVRSESPLRRPRVGWTFTDPAGHVHEYVRDADDVPRLPSLEPRDRNEPCGGECYDLDCQGTTVREWFCRECDAMVEPGFQLDYEVVERGIPLSKTDRYELTVQAPLSLYVQLSSPNLGVRFTGAAFVADLDGEQHQMELAELLADVDLTTLRAGEPTFELALYGEEYDVVPRKPTGP